MNEQRGTETVIVAMAQLFLALAREYAIQASDRPFLAEAHTVEMSGAWPTEILVETLCVWKVGAPIGSSHLDPMDDDVKGEDWIFVLNVMSGDCIRMTGASVQLREEWNRVGTLLIAASLRWVYWNPPSAPLKSARILFLPALPVL